MPIKRYASFQKIHLGFEHFIVCGSSLHPGFRYSLETSTPNITRKLYPTQLLDDLYTLLTACSHIAAFWHGIIYLALGFSWSPGLQNLLESVFVLV